MLLEPRNLENISQLGRPHLAERVENAESAQEGKEETCARGRRIVGQDLPPQPAPRRSNRHHKEPDRYGDYVMYGVQVRPYDSKLEAIRVLVTSNVLSSMDTDMAKNILQSILK